MLLERVKVSCVSSMQWQKRNHFRLIQIERRTLSYRDVTIVDQMSPEIVFFNLLFNQTLRIINLTLVMINCER